MTSRDHSDGLPHSETSALLGLRILAFDESSRRIRVGFDGKDAFKNPAGFVQGGMLAAMIDDSMGPAVWLTTKGELFPVTINMNISYVAAARPGPIFCEATVLKLGTTIGFVNAQLFDAQETLIAQAVSSVRLVKPKF